MKDSYRLAEEWRAKVMEPKGEECKVLSTKIQKSCSQVVSGKVNYEYRSVAKVDCKDHIHMKMMQNKFSS